MRLSRDYKFNIYGLTLCPCYSVIRRKYIKIFYYINPSVYKFAQLLNSNILLWKKDNSAYPPIWYLICIYICITTFLSRCIYCKWLYVSNRCTMYKIEWRFCSVMFCSVLFLKRFRFWKIQRFFSNRIVGYNINSLAYI